ncbi:helix-turn-helix domain-containing protein [Gordonia jacobaea]|uniref:helix-turn-helix domain-containing protein n=1 Tax=Gordonia jacobaea TaxID=122202 RepID=UPI0022E7B140|nr:helix-turn-helix domain-containing protein [Gordonia jacobaea]
MTTTPTARKRRPRGTLPETPTAPTVPETELAELMTSDELAEYLSVSRDTVDVWRQRGGGPQWVRAGRHIRYRRRDVVAWLDSTLSQGPAKPANRK